MTKLATILECVVLLLAPCLAAIPDEPLWTPIFCVLTMLALLIHPGGSFLGRTSAARKATLALFCLLGWNLLSVISRVIVQHGSHAYWDMMLRGWAIFATNVGLFLLARRAAEESRARAYVIALAAVIGAAIVAGIGVQEYLFHVRAGEPNWRVFATSTPDYLAGYLVMLLPVTLALCRGASRTWTVSLLFALAMALQIATTFFTGSRFALVSLLVSLIAFAIAMRASRPKSASLGKSAQIRLVGLGVFVLIAAILVGKPVIHRLLNPEANSGAFRVWTWKGSLRMAEAKPVFGTGIGTYVDLYPQYALTGFTRLAHNAYLQTADEAGIPALIALLAALSFVGIGAWPKRRFQESVEKESKDTFVGALASPNDRLLQCGLLAGLIAGAIQNLIDSDWYVFFLGATFWALAGLALGLNSRINENETPTITTKPKAALIVSGIAALAVLGFQIANVVAAGQAMQGRDLASQITPQIAQNAEAAYQDARTWAPLNGAYPSELGYNIYYKASQNLSLAESTLKSAIILEPNALNYKRLGYVLAAEGRQADAVTAFQTGLKSDPNSLDLLLALADVSVPEQKIGYYRHLTELEDTPVGTVRAIGLTEVKFAYADAAMANTAFSLHQNAEAAKYAERAARLLEAYADEGGSRNGQRIAMHGGKIDTQEDTTMAGIYRQVMKTWQAAAPPSEAATLAERAQSYGLKFDKLSPQP